MLVLNQLAANCLLHHGMCDLAEVLPALAFFHGRNLARLVTDRKPVKFQTDPLPEIAGFHPVQAPAFTRNKRPPKILKKVVAPNNSTDTVRVRFLLGGSI